MDDGDGAGAVEMLAGMPAEVLLGTIYNGSTGCTGCGCLMNPVTSMYSGGYCPDCTTSRGAKRVRQMMGR